VKALGKSFLVPAAALRLRQDRHYAPELAYFDDGSKVSFMTAAAADPHDNVFIGSGVLQIGGFAVCRVPAGAFN
jgi:arylesterase / paraoxonase